MFHDVTSLGDFLAQVLDAAQSIGGLSLLGKLSLVITLLVSSLKVAPITRLVWAKLGWAQVLVAPVLALVAGLVALGATGTPVTLPVLLAYLTAGGGAVFLHELLDGLKGMPGLGAVYVKVIEVIEALLVPGLTPRGSSTPTPSVPVAPGAAQGPQVGVPAPADQVKAQLSDRRIGRFL